MTARLFSSSLESGSLELLSPISGGGLHHRNTRQRSPGKSPQRQRSDLPLRNYLTEVSDLSVIWANVLELLQQGVIVTSRHLKPVYANAKAKELCQHLTDTEATTAELPLVVSEICHRLLRENVSTNHPLVMECQSVMGQTMRISARWLPAGMAGLDGNCPKVLADDKESLSGTNVYRQAYILVMLENCYDQLREELRIEQKKYDLTEREAEIWMLLRQEYTYQEIARMLQISLNTVKTHVKNVYAKRRSFQGQDKFWCSE